MEQRFIFPKAHRLVHRKDLESVVSGGKAINAYPLRAVYRIVEPDPEAPVKMAVSVPKRLFKRAVKRNLLKRRIREAFRLNRHLLLTASGNGRRTLHLLVVFTGKEEAPFELIQSKIILILQRLQTVHAQDSFNVDGRPADGL